MSHPDDSTFERFVIGALSDNDEASFIAHTSGCTECAAKLQAEAKLEVAFAEVQANRAASADAKVVQIRKRRNILPIAIGAVALAASVAFFLRSRTPTEPATTVPEMGAAKRLNVTIETAATPNPAIDDIEETLSLLKEPIRSCLEQRLVTPFEDVSRAVFTFTTEVEPDGRVEEPSKLRAYPSALPRISKRGSVLDEIPCVSRAMKKLTFHGNGKRTVIEVRVRFSPSE